MGSHSWRSLIAVAVLGLMSSGCLYVPYCLPEFQRIGAIEADWDRDEVHVFRVDSTSKEHNGTSPLFVAAGLMSWPPGTARSIPFETHELTRIHPSDSNKVDGQRAMRWGHGKLCFGMINTVAEATHHTLAVRLYRPGFETIDVRASNNPLSGGYVESSRSWQPVFDIADFEAAVDAVIGLSSTDDPSEPFADSRPAAGDVSPAHLEALLFCAAEYERIARMAADDELEAEALRERLRAKAEGLRQRAAE